MERTRNTSDKPKRTRKRILWFSILGVVLLLAVIGGIEVYRILYQPQDLFAQSTMDPALLATPSATPLPTPEPEEAGATGSQEATATPTVRHTVGRAASQAAPVSRPLRGSA